MSGCCLNLIASNHELQNKIIYLAVQV